MVAHTVKGSGNFVRAEWHLCESLQITNCSGNQYVKFSLHCYVPKLFFSFFFFFFLHFFFFCGCLTGYALTGGFVNFLVCIK